MRTRPFLSELKDQINTASKAINFRDAQVASSTTSYIDSRLLKTVESRKLSWENFLTFWPPRMLKALQGDRLICFFGAGLSMPSGMPSWSEMLRDYFGIDQSILSDDDLQSDPLTQAELASHRLGIDKVQALLREKLGGNYAPSTNHFLVAALRLPFYITTNYDRLFEEAWKTVNGRINLLEITTDADVANIWPDRLPKPSDEVSYLFKIHGSLSRFSEHLILTRSDYRRHYRSNDTFFSAIRSLLSSYHILFLGFSHKDPEVTRLVEDAIWQFERREQDGQQQALKAKQPGANNKDHDSRPNLYSLQFNMRSHTPEIFAARGIVALSPPLADPSVTDIRSSSLARGLADLIAEDEAGIADQLSLDSHLEVYSRKIHTALEDGLNLLTRHKIQALESIVSGVDPKPWLETLREDLGQLAGQGLYLLNHEGRITASSLSEFLTNNKRRTGPAKGFSERPYFQQARTYRQPFVSDAFESTFNKQLTFALCVPILDEKGLAGLLFSACQTGAWTLPLDAAEQVWADNRRLSVLLVDANGVALIPPNKEFSPEESQELEDGELPKDNKGYPYHRLLALSRRDKLISRIMENIVPLRQDDDVLSLGPDIKQYTVVTESPLGRWKIGISDSVLLSQKIQST